jgi:hypothetical protein
MKTELEPVVKHLLTARLFELTDRMRLCGPAKCVSPLNLTRLNVEFLSSGMEVYRWM